MAQPRQGSVIPPTKTQAAVPDETLAHAELSAFGRWVKFHLTACLCTPPPSMTSPSGLVAGTPKAPFAMSRMAQLNENLHRTGLAGRWTIPRSGVSESIAADHSTFRLRPSEVLSVGAQLEVQTRQSSFVYRGGSGAVCGVISSRRGSQNPVLYWPWQVRRGCTD